MLSSNTIELILYRVCLFLNYDTIDRKTDNWLLDCSELDCAWTVAVAGLAFHIKY
jgi:hypothetical protein